jgi:hypothetical protein
MTWQEIVQQILETGKILGSKAYEISLLQVYNVVRIDAIWGILTIILGVITFLILKKYYSDWKEEYDGEWAIALVGLVSGIFFFISAMLWTNVIMYLGNPQWYAAKWLLEDLLGK